MLQSPLHEHGISIYLVFKWDLINVYHFYIKVLMPFAIFIHKYHIFVITGTGF